MAVAGSGAKIMAKVEAGAENKYFLFRNTGMSNILLWIFKQCCGAEIIYFRLHVFP